MKSFAISCLGMLVLYGALAAGCDWATETPPDDAKYKYFVAKSYSDSSASDAANKAERDIDAQLGRLFGTKLDVRSEFYSDATNADGTIRSYERTIGIISLKGLERQKSDTQKISGGWTGCVQYRYLKTEIAKERERLNSLPAAELNQPTTFTEVAGDLQCKGAPVEIVTVPAGAYVTLDNGKYQGSAPIKFGNVCNGKYSLEITKENYVPVTQQLIVPTNGRVSKTLKRDSKRITVRTSLKNSQIEINGINKGKEPVAFNAPLGIEQTITAINSEAVKITRTRTFSKYSDPEYIISMEKLPGKIDFSAFKVRNPGVNIKVDGTTIAGNTTKELSPDASHNISFSKKGYYNINKSLDIAGGETTYYPSQELRFSKEPDGTRGIFLGVGASMTDDIKGFGLNLDLGVDIKTKYLYGAVAAQLNYISVPDAKMTFDYHNTNKDWYIPHTAEIGLSYWEILYSQLGINLTKRLTVFGIGSLGLISHDSENSKTTASVNIGVKTKAVFRYGFGLQYSIAGDGTETGVRFAYLTGKTNLSSSDVGFSHISNYDYSPLNFENKAFESYPKQINSFNVTFFMRGFTALGEKHE